MGAQIVNFRPSGDQEWAQWAECAKPDQPLMFPHENDAEGIEQAKAVCAGCPVVSECLGEALARSEGFGIWGGMTTDERRALKRRDARKARPKQKAPKKRQPVSSPKPVQDVDLAEAAGL